MACETYGRGGKEGGTPVPRSYTGKRSADEAVIAVGGEDRQLGTGDVGYWPGCDDGPRQYRSGRRAHFLREGGVAVVCATCRRPAGNSRHGTDSGSLHRPSLSIRFRRLLCCADGDGEADIHLTIRQRQKPGRRSR